MSTKTLLLISFLITFSYMLVSNLFLYNAHFINFAEKSLAKGIKSFLIYPAKLMYGMGMIGGGFLFTISGIITFILIWLFIFWVIFTFGQIIKDN